jgi:hypothetical protein
MTAREHETGPRTARPGFAYERSSPIMGWESSSPWGSLRHLAWSPEFLRSRG